MNENRVAEVDVVGSVLKVIPKLGLGLKIGMGGNAEPTRPLRRLNNKGTVLRLSAIARVRIDGPFLTIGLEIMMVAETGEDNLSIPPNPRLGERLVLDPKTRERKGVDKWKYHPSKNGHIQCGVELSLYDALLEEELGSRRSRPVSRQRRCRRRRRRRRGIWG